MTIQTLRANTWADECKMHVFSLQGNEGATQWHMQADINRYRWGYVQSGRSETQNSPDLTIRDSQPRWTIA